MMLRERVVAPVLVLALLAVCFPCDAQSKSEANLGRVAWEAFSCSTFAELAGDKTEQQRLFKVGYAAGQKFVAGVRDKSLSEAYAREAPVAVLMLMQGPSVDFVVGRIFENAMEDAFDAVVKTDLRGLPVADPREWVSDDGVKRTKARNRFSAANCDLIR